MENKYDIGTKLHNSSRRISLSMKKKKRKKNGKELSMAVLIIMSTFSIDLHITQVMLLKKLKKVSKEK